MTGSNTGIGYVTARELARKGAKVIVAARNVKKGEDAVKRIKAELGDAPGAMAPVRLSHRLSLSDYRG